MTIEKTIQARQTTKGLRIWLEGSALDYAGLYHGKEYCIRTNEPMHCIELIPVNEGGIIYGKVRKVAGTKDRPVIDLQSKALNKIFSEGTVFVRFFGDDNQYVYIGQV